MRGTILVELFVRDPVDVSLSAFRGVGLQSTIADFTTDELRRHTERTGNV
jgi:hypothetical protein